MLSYEDIAVDKIAPFVGLIEMRRPPHNYFDTSLIRQIATAMEAFDEDDLVRAVVLCAQGKSFCAGANIGERSREGERIGTQASHLYYEAVRLLRTKKPIVAAVHGAAIGGGLGVACAADFRVTCPEAGFSANFTKLGVHPGFGLTVLLPELVGKNRAELLFYTGRRISGEEAVEIGLASICVPREQVRAEAIKLATEIAASAPLAIISTRKTMRGNLADRIKDAAAHELKEQAPLFATTDFKEGAKAVSERRAASFKGR